MSTMNPVAEVEPHFSSNDATPTPWSEASDRLEKAEVYWISTVLPDGRPHVTPMIGLWLDDALFFTTGETERKARNPESIAHVAISIGCNSVDEGLDVVLEGDAVRVTEEPRLQRIADTYASTYKGWHFDERDGAFLVEGGGTALVFEAAPGKSFGSGKGEPFSQTRWRC